MWFFLGDPAGGDSWEGEDGLPHDKMGTIL